MHQKVTVVKRVAQPEIRRNLVDLRTNRGVCVPTLYLVQSTLSGGRGWSGKSNVASTYD